MLNDTKRHEFDKDYVKCAATGRTLDILEQVANIPRASLTGREGSCPWCEGSTRFRLLDSEAGAVFCSHCHKSKNGDFLSAIQKGRGVSFREAIQMAADYLGLNGNGNMTEAKTTEDAITLIARSKNIPSAEAILAFGAKAIAKSAIQLPAYGPRGEQCTTFSVHVNGTEKQRKGLFANRKPAGLFFPHKDGPVRLPQPGETWHMVEGFKDAATLHHLGYLAVGLNTCFLAAKFAPLFTGVNVVLIPDRDEAGEGGATRSAAGLRGHASSVRLAVLPVEFTAKNGKDVRDTLRMKDGEVLLRDAIAKARLYELPESTKVPVVNVGFDEAQVASNVIPFLGNLGWGDDSDRSIRVYQRGGYLVEVTQNVDATVCGVGLPSTMLRIRPIPAAILRERITSAVRLAGPPKKNGDIDVVRPPQWLVDAIHQRGQYPPTIRSLTGIVRSPTLRPDGTVIQEPGYDERTGLLFMPDGEYPPIPEQPTKEQALHAAEELLDVVRDFPFKGPAHRSVWLAMVLTYVGRSAIDGPCPMFVVDANSRGTGKTLLCDAAGLIAYGDRLARKSWPDKDDEVRKTITAVALESLPAVLWDNVATVLGCPSLDSALTGTSWQDRILSTNKTTGTLPLTTVWSATGNNVVLGADTARRVLLCRIESDQENPEERNDFAHENLLSWVKQYRHQLAVHAVTVLRAFIQAGRPNQHLTAWGSYEAWSDLIRNAIVWLGLPDPWDTRTIVRDADRSSELLGMIHAGIAEADPDGQGITSGEIVRLLSTPIDDGADDNYPQLRAAMTELCEGKIDSSKIGCQLRQYVARVKAGRQLRRAKARAGVAKWSIQDCDRQFRGGDGGDGGHVSSSSRERDTPIPLDGT